MSQPAPKDIPGPKVFLSYRRSDCAGHVGRLYDILTDYFGERHIFIDIDKIAPGEDFVNAITEAVAGSSVFLAIIGKKWLTGSDGSVSRLADPADFVRLEIASALKLGILVVPVLMEGASMPSTDQFPEELSGFPRRNAFEISDRRFKRDVDGLIQVIKRAMKSSGSNVEPEPGISRREGKIEPDAGDQPPRLRAEPAPNPSLETAHVLFMDIVGYSTLLIDEQTSRLKELQEIVRNTQEFQAAQHAGRLLRLPTGDGMALSFFGDPEAPVRCAVEVSRALRMHPELKLRMGVNSGLVYRMADINANMNIAGGGINMAQRVMDCGDAGHIILSKRVADDLAQLSRWAKHLHDLGEAEVKHGVRVHTYSLHNDEIGNPEVPLKLRARNNKPKRIILWLGVATAVIVIAGILLWPRISTRVGQATPATVTTPNDAPAHLFTYFLSPSDRSNSAEDERFTGNEQFHNGSRFTFVLIPEQTGALYLVNKGSGANGSEALNVLFPTPKNNNGSSMVAAHQRVEVGIHFNRYSGDENLSIIWTTRPVPELETIFKEAARTDFEIKNPDQIRVANEFLTNHRAPAPTAEIDSEKKQTTVRGRGEILISTRVLKHRDF